MVPFVNCLESLPEPIQFQQLVHLALNLEELPQTMYQHVIQRPLDGLMTWADMLLGSLLRNEQLVDVRIGPSGSIKKCTEGRGKHLVCAADAANEHKRLQGGTGGTFEVTVEGDRTVCVQRTDVDAGWAMDLGIACKDTSLHHVVYVGASDWNEKCIHVYARGLYCPADAADRSIRINSDKWDAPDDFHVWTEAG